ncbi:MAG: hypothetical protein IJK62_15175 [Bacteroidales bacterium]|nr:hypothetical protein [Bacteroidales bacterium]
MILFSKKKGKKVAVVPEVEIQVENITLELNDIVGFVKSRLELDNPKIEEVTVMNTHADANLLKTINNAVERTVKITFGDSLSIIYIMDVIDKRIVKILCLCVTQLGEDLINEFSKNNNIIRFK